MLVNVEFVDMKDYGRADDEKAEIFKAIPRISRYDIETGDMKVIYNIYQLEDGRISHLIDNDLSLGDISDKYDIVEINEGYADIKPAIMEAVEYDYMKALEIASDIRDLVYTEDTRLEVKYLFNLISSISEGDKDIGEVEDYLRELDEIFS